MFTRSFFARLLMVSVLASFFNFGMASAGAGSVSISAEGPAARTVRVGQNDVHLLDFVLNPSMDGTFKNFPISLTTSSDSSDASQGLLNGTYSVNFTDIKIVDRDTGAVVYGPVDADGLKTTRGGPSIDESTDTIAYFLFKGDLSFDRFGSERFALTVDIADEWWLEGMTISAALELDERFPLIKGGLKGKIVDNSAFLVPHSPIVSNTMTVGIPSLSFTLASVPSTGVHEYSASTVADIPLVGIDFTCGEASDCIVNWIEFQGYLDDAGTASDFGTNPRRTVHGTSLEEYIELVYFVDDTHTLTSPPLLYDYSYFQPRFEDFSWTIPAGATQTLTLMGTLTGRGFADGDGESIAFGLPTSDFVRAKDEDGNNIVISYESTANLDQTTYVQLTL